MSDIQSDSERNDAIMAIKDFDAAIAWQAEHAAVSNAPCTARIINALNAVIKGQTACAKRMASWQGLTLKDAMPLRIAGGIAPPAALGKRRSVGPGL